VVSVIMYTQAIDLIEKNKHNMVHGLKHKVLKNSGDPFFAGFHAAAFEQGIDHVLDLLKGGSDGQTTSNHSTTKR